jgi:hypothetical protein
MSESLLVVMAKTPELGKVKTRLAATLGDKQTLSVYEFLLNTTLNAVKNSGLTARVYWTSKPNDHSGEIFLQVEGDLGEKMKAVFEDSFATFSPVIMIGTDCPHITSEILQQAEGALKEADCVFGPASDGGYYLIGMKHFYPSLLKNISWSTDRVFKQSIEICEKEGLKYRLLETLTDIDEEKDWIEYINKENSLWKKS